MQPWAPTFAFTLQADDVDTPESPSSQGAGPAPHETSSCCHGPARGGSAGGAEAGGGQLMAQALLLNHPELGVSGVKVDHANHRVEVLADAESQVGIQVLA